MLQSVLLKLLLCQLRPLQPRAGQVRAHRVGQGRAGEGRRLAGTQNATEAPRTEMNFILLQTSVHGVAVHTVGGSTTLLCTCKKKGITPHVFFYFFIFDFVQMAVSLHNDIYLVIMLLRMSTFLSLSLFREICLSGGNLSGERVSASSLKI